MRPEGIVLEDHRYLALFWRKGKVIVTDFGIADEDLALFDLFDPGYGPQDRRLTRTTRAKENQKFSLFYLEADVVDYDSLLHVTLCYITISKCNLTHYKPSFLDASTFSKAFQPLGITRR